MRKLKRAFIASLLVTVAACADPALNVEDSTSVRASYEKMVESLGDHSTRKKAFPLALYRAAVPGALPDVPEDFDGDQPLALATERKDAPEVGSDAYFRALEQHGHRVAGMSPQTVVLRYVSDDSALLLRQEQWARDWQTRARIRSRNDQEEAVRRRTLLDKFHAIKPMYWWEGGKPFLKFFMANPLDVPLDRIEADFDLFDETGTRRLGSARVQGVLRTPLQPGSEATVLIDLAQYEAVARSEFRNFGETLQVRIAFRNAWAGVKSLIERDIVKDKTFEDRNRRVVDLLTRISEAKANLSRFRITFSE